MTESVSHTLLEKRERARERETHTHTHTHTHTTTAQLCYQGTLTLRHCVSIFALFSFWLFDTVSEKSLLQILWSFSGGEFTPRTFDYTHTHKRTQSNTLSLSSQVYCSFDILYSRQVMQKVRQNEVNKETSKKEGAPPMTPWSTDSRCNSRTECWFRQWKGVKPVLWTKLIWLSSFKLILQINTIWMKLVCFPLGSKKSYHNAVCMRACLVVLFSTYGGSKIPGGPLQYGVRPLCRDQNAENYKVQI